MAGGRPTDYDPEYHIDKAYKLSLLGMTDAEMADVFNVVESTLNLWKLKYQEFSESIKRGKADADSDIAFSLHRKAKGYKYREKTFETVEVEDPKTKQTKRKLVCTKIVHKEQAPDTAAAVIILKNRQPKYWRDKIQIDTRTDIHSLGDYEALAEKAKELAEKLGLADGRDKTTGT